METSIIGVDLGGTKVSSGRIMGNRIESISTCNISAHKNKEVVLKELIQNIKAVFNGSVSAIGLGAPGLVDTERGIVFSVQNIPSWQEVHLKEKLERYFNVPVFVNNDANCFTLGIQYFGAGKGYENIVGITLGTGLGTGIVINNKLYSGINCGAGELGMLPYLEHNYEYYCSGRFFHHKHRASGEELFRRAKIKDGDALDIFSVFGMHLGKLINTVLYVYDPEIIVLGGSICEASRFFNKSMQDAISTFEYQHVLKNLKVKMNTVKDIAVLGAAALCIDQENLFDNNRKFEKVTNFQNQ